MAWFQNLFAAGRSWPGVCAGLIGLIALAGRPTPVLAQSGSLQFSTNSFVVGESNATATITVVRTLGTNAVSVRFATADGTATAGADYTSVTTNLTFSGDQQTNAVAIPILNDLVIEPDKTINLTLSGPTGGASLGSPASAVLTLLDDDLPGLQFSTNNFSVSEGAGSAIVTVIRTGATNSTDTVDFTTTNGTATATLDYTPTSATLTFLPGETTQTVSVAIVDDSLPETDETVDLVLSNPSSGVHLSGSGTATLTIHDNEPPVLEFSAPTFSVPENGGSVTITVLRLGDPGVTGSVAYATSGQTAVDGQDFVGTAGVLPFAGGQLSNSFNVVILDDTILEDNETFLATLSNVVGLTLASNATTQVTIVNDERDAVKLTDADGDQVIVTLKGGGQMAVTGVIDTITLSGTGTNSTLTIKVKKGRTGDGLVRIGQISGHGGLQNLLAPQADLVGSGIGLDGWVGSVKVHDLLPGAGLVTGGTTNQTCLIQARNIGDGAVIDLGSSIRRMRAARFGDALLRAPRAASITIAGDKRAGIPANWEGELSLFGSAPGGSTSFTLGQLVVRQAITNALIDVLHGNAGKVRAQSLIDSVIYIGFTPTNVNQPFNGGTFEPTSFLGGLRLAGRDSRFANSVVAAATIGSSRLQTVTPDNHGVPFGFLVQPSLRGLTVREPPFRSTTPSTSDQGFGDFLIRSLSSTGP